jgi:hypothetical protein
MDICKCNCHIKPKHVIMYSMDIPCGCCHNHGWHYLDSNKNVLPDMVDKLVDKSIDDWNKYRKDNFIEYYPEKRNRKSK